MTAALDEHGTDDPTPLRQRRMAQRSKELAELMERRPDLWGVHGPADLVAESALWSA